MQRTLRRKKPRPSSLKQYSTMGTLSRMLDKPMGIPNRLVQNGADTGNAVDRHLGRHGKTVDAQRRDKAAQRLECQVFEAVFGHRVSLLQ